MKNTKHDIIIIIATREGQAMEISQEKLQALIEKAVKEQLANHYEKNRAELEAQAAAIAEKLPRELTLENVLKFSGALPETVYSRDTIRDILKETIDDIENWDIGGARLNEDILARFFSRIDREAKNPTTKEEYQAKRDAEEAEYQRQREAENAIVF
jgi:hypothetical protein